MSEAMIEAAGLSKRYHLGLINRQTLQDEVRYWWHRLRGRDPMAHMGKLLHAGAGARAGGGEPNNGLREHEFWALKDVSFSVQQGEVIGVIGRNGAGKSTLLKILSRITEPSLGEAVLNGRVGSLLEVGTGFHPELTGRENVFLNGAILGMRKSEIERKFDEIVSFAEIEAFIDTPVKRYSSGMYVRLAFSVAAHLDPEILLVDEVLAVGDTTFQRKCMGKMGDVAKEGRTILFVSHNMAAISNLCSRALLIEGGKLAADGPAADVIDRYLSLKKEYSEVALSERHDRTGIGAVRFAGIRMRSNRPGSPDSICAGDELTVTLDYESTNSDALADVSVAIMISNWTGAVLFMCWNNLSGDVLRDLPPKGILVCKVPDIPLPSGLYSVGAALVVNRELQDKIGDIASLHVIEGDYFRTGKLPSQKQGMVYVRHTWRAEETPPA
jgi:lipopolysaccharide transport system ATP-binding protein